MKRYDARCPICGHLNRNLYLEETDGWMECEECQAATQVMKYRKFIKIPVYTLEELPKRLTASR